MNEHAQETQGLAVRGYTRVVARWKWLIVGITVVAATAGLVISLLQTPMYRASAKLLYEESLDVSNPLSSETYTDPTEREAALESVTSIIDSQDMAARVRAILGSPGAASSATVQAEPQTTYTGDSLSDVVVVSAESSSARTAARVANAYAEAFTDWRREREQARVQNAIRIVKEAAKGYTTPAAQATAEYLMLKQRLRELEILKGTVTGNFTVIVPATPPSDPYAPRPVRATLLGLGIGLVVGLIAAFVLEQFNTRIEGEETLVAGLKMPILGRIPRLAKRAEGNGMLVTLDEPNAPTAEAFRMLRGNLDFISVDADVKTIMVTSAIQHEGKSVAACNLAVSLALTGKRVVLVDGDLRSPRIHSYMHLSNLVGISSVVANRVTLQNAVKTLSLRPPADGDAYVPGASSNPGPATGTLSVMETAGRAATDIPLASWDGVNGAVVLHVLTAGPMPPNPAEIVAAKRTGAALKELRNRADYVILDSPAMLAVSDATALAGWADGVLYVVNPEKIRRPIMQRAAEQLEKLPCRKLGMVLVGCRTHAHRYYRYYSHEKATEEGKAESRSQRRADS